MKAGNVVSILAYDHVGIRVRDRREALAFYESLGFREAIAFPDPPACEMENEAGVRINLIFNAAPGGRGHNVLLDAPVKHPGVTHAALVVSDVYALEAWCHARGIVVTEPPHAIGPRRIALFIRDPDGNVLEFNQLVEETRT